MERGSLQSELPKSINLAHMSQTHSMDGHNRIGHVSYLQKCTWRENTAHLLKEKYLIFGQ